MKETLSNVKNNRVIFAIILIYSFCMIFFALFSRPVIIGDGREYLGMTISFVEHLSPELRESDIIIRNSIESKNQISFPESFEYVGYYPSQKGEMFSYHFWFYSLLNAPVFFILRLFEINELKSFQLTNSLLYLLLIFKLFSTKIFSNERVRLFFLIVTFVSPIVLYLKWTHTEVYSYVFLFLGLITFLEEKKRRAMVYVSLAALQNPAISIVAIYFLIHEFIQNRHVLFKNSKVLIDYLILGVISSLNVVPYLFYWVHFKRFSMITASGFSSFDFFSFAKVWSLFFDLNYGLIIYVPVLIILLLVSLLKREKLAWISLILMLSIAVVDATQLNWNSGMMYINRYSVWLIPILLYGSFYLINKINVKKMLLLVILLITSTGILTIYCFKENDYSNHLKFSPVSKYVIAKFPALYNPEYETFIERAQGTEGINKENFPVLITNSETIRKTLVTEGSSMRYLNGPSNINANSEIFRILKINANQDIFLNNIEAAFGPGWYQLESSNQINYRWTEERSTLLINSDKEEKVAINFNIQSFLNNRNCKILINRSNIYNGIIPANEAINLEFEANLVNGLNTIEIISDDGSDVPSDLDTRPLSFSINSMKISGEGSN